jgi:hypothetical protein
MLPLAFVPSTSSDRPLSGTDYDVVEDDQRIGRVYEMHDPPDSDMTWCWTIMARVPNPARVRTTGYAATFDEAKAQFREHWFRVWKRAPA